MLAALLLAGPLAAASGRLEYSVTFGGKPVIEASPLGITVDKTTWKTTTKRNT